jgi:hypothetical protein
LSTSRPAAWADPTDTEPVVLPSGYTIALRRELDVESYYVLNDILLEVASTGWREARPEEIPEGWKPSPSQRVYQVRELTREHRKTLRSLNRDVVLLWVDEWDIRPLDAPPDAPAMPVTKEALSQLRRDVAEEIEAAVGRHQEPFLQELLGLFGKAPAPSGNAPADLSTHGDSKSSGSASARTRPRTKSPSGRSTGTP